METDPAIRKEKDMAGYRNLTDDQKKIYVGRTKNLRDAGCSAEQIADKLKRPLVEVKEWFGLIDIYEESVKAKKD
jgi:hypothetical protein